MSNLMLRLAVTGLFVLAALGGAVTVQASDLSADSLMALTEQRQSPPPHLYEEQTLVLTDRHGRRETRRMRSFLRREADGSAHFMLLFDAPAEIAGLALLSTLEATGARRNFFYLPALGDLLLEAAAESSGDHFLGTDFAVEDLTGEVAGGYRYQRRSDEEVDGVRLHVIDAYPADDDGAEYPAMRHFIDAQRLVRVRSDHFDRFGRLHKRLRLHDLQPAGGGRWRANILHIDNLRSNHQSVIRVDRRVLSRDYVPIELFRAEWLFANRRALEARP